MKLKNAAICSLAGLILAGICTAAANSQSDPGKAIFRIGTFDRSSREFPDITPKLPVHFIVGKSDPSKDWFARQAARLAMSAEEPSTDAASAPWTISFSLSERPAPTYRLLFYLLIKDASVPTLSVTINGKRGNFYLHPRLDSNMGDMLFDAIYSNADVSFSFPGNYLHAGENTITLQAIEEADKQVPDAALIYDAIELDKETAPFAPGETSAQISPTIFYQQHGGELREIVDVFVRYGQPVKRNSSVDLEIDGKSDRRALTGKQEFGEEKLEFLVPEFSAHTKANLSWRIACHTQHEQKFIDPKKKWTLFLVPHVHLDIGYSDYQAKVAAIQSRVINEALDLTAKHPDFRFSIDGFWPLEQFLKTRSPAEQRRVIAAIQKKQLYLPPQYANLLTGFPTAETLIRSFYPSANFSRVHGTPFDYANITDVPSYSWSYASILASARIKYFLAGSNNFRAPVLYQGHLNENSPIWWEGPDGQKVLLWYSLHYMQMQVMFGLPPLIPAGRDTLPVFLQMYEHPSYHASAAIIFGSQVENTDLFPQQAELAQQWNNVYAYPKILYSGFHDALEIIAEQFGTNIPTVRGDGGPYWEDGIASDAYYAAIERENEMRGPSAEKIATLASLADPKLAVDKAELDRMWINMLLMDEHTWAAAVSVADPTSQEAVKELAVKDSYAVKAREQADFIVRNGMASLADSISTGPGSLIVFNTLNWKRSGLVTIDLRKSDEIIDLSTGNVVPIEIVSAGNDFRHVRFTAVNIPAIGYKVFQLHPTDRPVIPAAAVNTTTLESQYYRVELEPSTGAVRSIYDKQLQRELVDQQSSYRFGQYLYVSGGDKEPNSIIENRPVSPQAKLEVYPAGNGRLISTTRTPYGWVARMESANTNTPKIVTEIRLFEREKKIEFIEDVSKTDVNSKEAVYFAFPFAMKRPQFQYEIQTGVVDPAKDMYPGAGHEWFSVQHWVSVQEDGVSATVMPLDTPLVTLGDINRGAWPIQFGERTGTIFSYLMNNYWNTNYRAGQGGDFHFRYVITSAAATDVPMLSRLGWEEMTPIERAEVTAADKAQNTPQVFDGKQCSFLQVNDPNLVLTAWKPAEAGLGTIMRFLDLGSQGRTITAQTPLLRLQEAWQTDSVERNEKQLSLQGSSGFQFTIHPHEIVTVRLIGKSEQGRCEP